MLTVIVILLALNVLIFSVRAAARTESSGAAGAPTPSAENCPDARKAVRFYQRRYAEWRAKMGVTARPPARAIAPCPRWLAAKLKRKAYQARVAYARWWEYHYAWWKWLPDKWARIGACETGYGKRPGQWTWNSGTYQGAFGFYYGTWDAYKPRGAPSEAYLATPRQQYQCALNVYAAHGYGAWGCGGA